jgi:hypothetical protein
MSKTGIDLFTSLVANVRAMITKAVAYTVLVADEYIKVNATVTMTLPVLSTLIGTTASRKLYFFENISTAANGYLATIAAGSGNTIGGRASIALRVGEKLIVAASETDTDWEILWPAPMAPAIRNVVTIVATTSGTTVINAIDASGCPIVGEIVDIQTEAQDTFAGNIAVKNTNGTIATIAKSATAGLSVSATALTTPSMAKGDLLTIESDSTNGNARVRIYLSVQTLTVDG